MLIFSIFGLRSSRLLGRSGFVWLWRLQAWGRLDLTAKMHLVQNAHMDKKSWLHVLYVCMCIPQSRNFFVCLWHFFFVCVWTWCTKILEGVGAFFTSFEGKWIVPYFVSCVCVCVCTGEPRCSGPWWLWWWPIFQQHTNWCTLCINVNVEKYSLT